MQPRSMTPDQAAAYILIHGTPADMQRLRSEMAVATGEKCPECGETETEDNGCSGSDLEYRCCGCDHRWEASSCTITLPPKKVRS